MPLYTFTDVAQHPVDYVAPNHFSSTHRLSIFTQVPMAQRWTEDDVQLGLVGLHLTERLPDGTVNVTTIGPEDLGGTLNDRFGIALDDDELALVRSVVSRPAPTSPS